MTNHRYSLSFIVSSILFTLLGFSLFLLAQKIEKPKQLSKSVIKVAILTPVVKKIIEKKPPAPVIVPPIPLPPKVQKKVEPKKVIKKKVHKKKIRKKRVVKKKVIKKRVVKKRVVKKKIIKKRVVKKKIIKKSIVKKIQPRREEVYTPVIPTPQPKRVIRPAIKAPVVHRKVPSKPQKVDKSVEKQQFLSQVRNKIIANKRYPKMALRRHIQGAVKIKFDITSSGNVSNIRYINGKKILQKGARKAIEKSFPMAIPSYLRSELPIKDIYLTIHFNIH
jgi:protein TonB